EDNIREHAFLISFSVIVSGGHIRMEDGLNKNQSTIIPFLRQISITFLHSSSLLNCSASISPLPRISFIVLCFINLRNSFSLAETLRNNFDLFRKFNAALPAAQLSGWPPKVVICPKAGLSLS